MKIPQTIKLDSYQQPVADRLKQLSDHLNPNRFSMAWFKKVFKLNSSPKSIYIYGSVGRGKTMLMDLFCEQQNQDRCSRIHFHEFMQDVHRQLRDINQNSLTTMQPVIQVAVDISRKIDVLCFDEFQVDNIADAMIMSRLFEELFKRKVVLIATSNQHPDELYKGGLHRERFLPFIETLKKHSDEIELDGILDYRIAFKNNQQRFISPHTAKAREELDNIFRHLAHGVKGPHQLQLPGGNRSIFALYNQGGVSWFHFDQLCRSHMGTKDYLHLIKKCHTIIIEQIPILSEDEHNEALRLIMLIDILYDNKIQLIVSASSQVNEIYTAGKHIQAFNRTQSRLIEMTGATIT